MPDKPGAAPLRRQRLSPQRQAELFEAVIDLLSEVGYESLSMEAVAARSKSSKATLYRQWKTKPQLVVAALRGTRSVALDNIDTGSLEGDLRETVRRIGERASRDTALLQALGRAVRDDPELLRALREVIVEPEEKKLNSILARAVARGELRDGHPARDFVTDLVVGALAARPMTAGMYADVDYLNRFLDAVILPALRHS